MPVYYLPSGWCTLTSATNTVTTATHRITVASATSATTTTGGWYSPTGVVWAANDISTIVRPTTLISPARLYYARRSYAQAMEHELHDHYLMEQRRQRRDLERHSEEARSRSLELLLSHLTPAQRESFEKNQWFVIEGGLSKQRYRIRWANHMVANIDVLDGDDKVEHRLCGHCDLNEVPPHDQLLAQKMMLEFDEERFLKLANRHRAA